MSSGFDRDTAVRRLEGPGERFEAQIAPDWSTARGPHGGYIAAIIMRALTETVADPERAARSFTIHFLRSPEPGAVHIDVTLERKGRSLSTLTARMEQEGKLIALALSAFSVPWEWPEVHRSEMPEVPPADPERRSPDRLIQAAPQFMEHLVMQPRIGGIPFSATAEPMLSGGWLGLSEPRIVDPIALVFFSDAWLPAIFVGMDGFARVPTIDLTVHFRAPLRPSDPEELLLARFHTDVIHDGFFEEDGIIWAKDGTLLAQSRQLGLVMPFKPS